MEKTRLVSWCSKPKGKDFLLLRKCYQQCLCEAFYTSCSPILGTETWCFPHKRASEIHRTFFIMLCKWSYALGPRNDNPKHLDQGASNTIWCGPCTKHTAYTSILALSHVTFGYSDFLLPPTQTCLNWPPSSQPSLPTTTLFFFLQARTLFQHVHFLCLLEESHPGPLKVNFHFITHSRLNTNISSERCHFSPLDLPYLC